MKHIHPFPARMAPEIALSKLQALAFGQTVLDPMCGSGMVLSQAVRGGVNAIGVDLDPLAELISRVGATPVDEMEASAALQLLLHRCAGTDAVFLPWIDDDLETSDFVDFWFGPKQKEQLRRISFHLQLASLEISKEVVDVLKVALSRLVVTKEPKASLARDTAHSRPHRTIAENDFDVLAALPASLRHVLSALDASAVRARVETRLGDARVLSPLKACSIDCIVTSPPYLNAIDYMRGHRMSLVWLGFSLKNLREIRRNAIGAERALGTQLSDGFLQLLDELGLAQLESRNKNMLDRYYSDLVQQTKEAFRVLKRGAVGTYVIGNSTIRGAYVRNSELLKRAGLLAGFEIVGETEREIPGHKRYMPMTVTAGNSLAGRMRTEHIIDFRRPA